MPIEQQRYQIRFDLGLAGAAAIAGDADVIVWVDAIPDAARPVPLAELGELAPPSSPSQPSAVIEASLPSAAAAARWIVDLQTRLARRIVVAIVAAGEPREASGTRFAVEDFLAAGSVIDQLAALGLDATSPEAAAAEGAFRHLSRAVAHLVTASVTASERVPEAAFFRLNAAFTTDQISVLRPHPDDQTRPL